MTTVSSSNSFYIILCSDPGPQKPELHKLVTLDEDRFRGLIGNRNADANVPRSAEAKKNEEAKVKPVAEALTLAKDAP